MNYRIETRKELPLLLNYLGFDGYGVEIGVYKGVFSENIIKNSKLSILFSVDCWVHFENEIYNDVANGSQKEQNDRYIESVKRLSNYGLRSVCLRMKSIDASKLFSDNSLDFVYIDANHSFEGCKEDIKIWYPKVKKGGLFSGHDYLDEIKKGTVFGVKKAVDEFFNAEKINFLKTNEEYPTWYCIK